VLDSPERAHGLINDFLPRLAPRLHETDLLVSLPTTQRTKRLAALTEYVHLGYWLTEDSFRPDLAQNAYDLDWLAHREFSPKARLDGSQLLNMMLLKIEAKDLNAAKDLYESHERTCLVLPPTSPRFARNPRALLYAYLNSDSVPEAVLIRALKDFQNLATRWEKDVCPIPNVTLVGCARILWACHSLRGNIPTLKDILPLLK